jgi:GTP-binding protein
VALLPAAPPAAAPPAAPPAVAVVGRPNVGKSSLVNAILGEERVVVDAAPGTTRDAVDTVLERDGRRLVLIDTAGLRRPSRVREAVEAYGVARTRRAMARAQVAVLVLDAAQPVTDQDQHIARQAADAGCGLVIALNKWDLVASAPRRDPRREREVRRALRFVAYAPLVVTSAVQGWGVDTLLETIAQVAAAHRARIPTGVLNRIVGEAVRRNQPPADAAGRRLRIYYATQPEAAPPRIVLFVNDPARMPPTYQRYLEGAIRRVHPLPGVPLRFALRRRGETA